MNSKFFIMIMTAATLGLGPLQSARADSSLTLAFKTKVDARLGELTLGDLLQKERTSPQIIQRYSGISLEGVQGGTLQASHVLELLRHEGLDLDSVKVEPPMQIQVTLSENADQGSVAGVSDATTDINNLKKVAPVLVALRSLGAGEQITAEDFKEEMRDASVSEKQHLTAGALQLKGKKAVLVNPVAEGSALQESDYEAILTPKKGDLVTISVQNKDFQIRTVGRVKEVQDSGARVLVENSDSKKEIWGQAVSSSEVKVVF